MVSLSSLLIELDAAKKDLTAAQSHYAEVVNDVAIAKANLEFRRAELICNGIDGKNAEQREAALRLELANEHAELAALEQELVRVRCRLEITQVAFTAIRYKIRAIEALREVA